MASNGVRWILLLNESGKAISISPRHAYILIFSSSVEFSWFGFRNQFKKLLPTLKFMNRPKTNMMISSGWILLTSFVWSWPVIPTVRNVQDLYKIERRISSSRCRGSMSGPLKGVKSPLSSALIDRQVFDRKSKIGPLWYKPSFRARFSSVLKNVQVLNWH